MITEIAKEVLTDLSNTLVSIEEVNTTSQELGCVDGKIIGTGRTDYTQGATIYNLSINNKNFALIDIPGIEGDESKYEETIKNALEKAHIVFYVNGSEKKIEKESLEKIKKYMHDGTSVYSIFNVHCKAKKERIPEIDKLYSEELNEAYKKHRKIEQQTREELIPFLGSNYKGSLCLNGLLGFCALAFTKKNTTSIKEDSEKPLRKDQEKYLNEYHGNKERMIADSHILQLADAIQDKANTFEKDIWEENLKKLNNRMFDMLSKIKALKTRETKKINGFITAYNEFESNCYNAKEDFIMSMSNVASNTATDAFYDLMNELFDVIEQKEGKVSSKEIQKIVESNKNDVIAKIEKGINLGIEQAQIEYREAVGDAQERLKTDFEREQIKFEISLSSSNVKLDNSFEKALKYN